MLYFSLFFVLPLCFGVFLPSSNQKCGPQIDVDEYFKVNYDDDEFYFHVPPALPPKTSEIQKDLEDCGKNEQGNCGIGWKSFNRPTGEWCIKIFYEDVIPYVDAAKKCEEQGAALSGLQNQVEAYWIALTASIKITPETGSIWVGLKRKTECLKVGRTKECPAYGSFDWTDNSTTGLDGMLWSSGQPDNSGRTQDCTVLAATANRKISGYPLGTIDDVGCQYDFAKSRGKPRAIKGYVCGKRA